MLTLLSQRGQSRHPSPENPRPQQLPLGFFGVASSWVLATYVLQNLKQFLGTNLPFEEQAEARQQNKVNRVAVCSEQVGNMSAQHDIPSLVLVSVLVFVFLCLTEWLHHSRLGFYHIIKATWWLEGAARKQAIYPKFMHNHVTAFNTRIAARRILNKIPSNEDKFQL